MSKLSSFIKLSLKEKIILLQILVIAIFLLPILKLISFRFYSSKVIKYEPKSSKFALNKILIIKKMYKIFEKNYPINLKCFSKSLLFCILLRIYKLPYTLHLSWQIDKNTIKLHTFVSSNGYYLIEPVKNFKNIL